MTFPKQEMVFGQGHTSSYNPLLTNSQEVNVHTVGTDKARADRDLHPLLFGPVHLRRWRSGFHRGRFYEEERPFRTCQ